MYFKILKTVINKIYKFNFVLFQKCFSKCPYHMQILPTISASGMNASQRNKESKKCISTQSQCTYKNDYISHQHYQNLLKINALMCHTSAMYGLYGLWMRTDNTAGVWQK